ncbi:MAG: hypothetical protein ACRDRA_20585 [Pseudonocardiaceae bacterium]
MNPETEACPAHAHDIVGRVSRWWALSPLDNTVHMAASEHPSGWLAARCGARLPTGTHQHDQPPPGPPCEPCRVIFIADVTRPGRSPVEPSPRDAPSDRPVPPVGDTGDAAP